MFSQRKFQGQYFRHNKWYWQLFYNEKNLRSFKIIKKTRHQPVFQIYTRKTFKFELTLSFGRCVSEENAEVCGWLTNIVYAAQITHQPSMRKYSGKPYISSESVLKLFITRQVHFRCLCATECRTSLNLFVFNHVEGLKAYSTKNNRIETENWNFQRQQIFLTFEFGLGISLAIRMRLTLIFALIWVETTEEFLDPRSFLKRIKLKLK